MEATSHWVAFIRHGVTEWNLAGKIQGHTDVPLSPLGREAVTAWRLPDTYRPDRWVSSPLQRARETANLLGCETPQIEHSLTEMHWGEWEGLTLEQLRADPTMQANENRGLDFRPVNGESPRLVRRRVEDWLGQIGDAGQNVVAVTHKGVIRAVMSLATGWDMKDSPPYRLRWDCAHVFNVEPGGKISVREMNVDLTGRTRAG